MAKNKPRSRKSQEDEKLTLNQGYVKDSDLEPGSEDVKVMKADEVDRYAEAAKSKNKTPKEGLKGEGDHEAAESYNDAATGFAKKQEAER